MNKYSRQFSTLIFAVTVALAACSHDVPSGSTNDPRVHGTTVTFAQHAPPGIETATIVAEREDTIELSGRVVWDEDHTVRVYSPFAGRVARIIAAVGDTVASGQALASIDSPDYGQAQADFRKADAAQKLASANLNRARELYDHGVVAGKDVEEAESVAASADAERDRTLQVLKTFADVGHLVDGRMVLRSPIAGVVVERSINPGAQLNTEQDGHPLFVITNPTTRWIALDVREPQVQLFKAGDWFDFQLGSTAAASTSLKAQVIRIDDYLDPASRVMRVIGKIENAKDRLRAESFITARVQPPRNTDPVVPASAVYLLGNDHYAFVKDGNSFVRRRVTLGHPLDDRLVVRSGLGRGDTVVVHGALFLQQLLQTSSQS